MKKVFVIIMIMEKLWQPLMVLPWLQNNANPFSHHLLINACLKLVGILSFHRNQDNSHAIHPFSAPFKIRNGVNILPLAVTVATSVTRLVPDVGDLY